MDIERLEEDGVTVVVVRGVIRLGESAQRFSRFLREVLGSGSGPVLVDLEGIDNVDSTGLGELVGHLQRFEEQGRRLAFVNPAPRIQRLFALTRLDQVIPIYPSRSSALAELGADSG